LPALVGNSFPVPRGGFSFPSLGLDFFEPLHAVPPRSAPVSPHAGPCSSRQILLCGLSSSAAIQQRGMLGGSGGVDFARLEEDPDVASFSLMELLSTPRSVTGHRFDWPFVDSLYGAALLVAGSASFFLAPVVSSHL